MTAKKGWKDEDMYLHSLQRKPVYFQAACSATESLRKSLIVGTLGSIPNHLLPFQHRGEQKYLGPQQGPTV